MPIVEFACSKCGHRFEKLVLSRRNGGNPPCPRCGEPDTTWVPSSFATKGVGGGSACSSCTASSCAGCGGASSNRK